MTEQIDIPRRTLLGALGAVGIGSAAGGVGTSAYFSDVETFTGNSLVAGELDLKVDWEEHYSDWSEDETTGIGQFGMVPGPGLTGFPSSAPLAEQTVFVEDVAAFMANTAIEAFPDPDPRVVGPGQVTPSDYDALRVEIDDDICDLPADLDGVLSHPYRTRGTFGGQTTDVGDPLINIADVKPGDFGEVTFSIHVCGNPAYLWLTGALRDASENGVNEPEGEDPDEDQNQDGSLKDQNDPDGETVELLDEIRVALWYDTGEDGRYGAAPGDKDAGEGDNVFGTGETFLPLNGSLRSVLTALEGGMFPLDAEPVSPNGGTGGAGGAGGGGVALAVGPGDGASIAGEVITTRTDPRFQDGSGGGTARNYQCADYEQRLDVGDVVGSEIINPETTGLQVGTTYSGCTTVTVDALDDDTGTITLSSSGPVRLVSVKGGPDGEHVYVFDDPVVLDEVVFTTPGDHEISNVDVCCPVLDDPDVPPLEIPGRQCFPNSTTAYVGFEWWLPVDHANEIQSDSVSFDLGFYAEQCRHNDGSGQPPENGGIT